MTTAIGSIATTLQRTWADAGAATQARSPHAWIVDLMERDGSGILRMLWRLLGDEADVLDAYQDCFCKLALRGGSSDLRCAKAYAYRTASNIAIELLRGRKRRRDHWDAIVADRGRRTESGRADVDETPSSAAGDRLRGAIARLPQHLRNVVVLRDLSRMSYEEVGRTLGIEPATARVYRRHAVVRLADALNNEAGS